MSADILIALFGELAASLVLKFGELSVKMLLEQPAVLKATKTAIATTASEFKYVEGLDVALEKWCQSESFADLLEKLRKGERGLPDDAVVTSFILTTQFYYEHDTGSVAQQILTVFARNLEKQLYATAEGLELLAGKMESHHLETSEKLGALQQQGYTYTDQLTKIGEGIQFLVSDKIDKNPDMRERVYSARIDEARNLLEEGKPKSARAILERVRHDIAKETPSSQLQFRVATNLGACALELDETGVAIAQFRAALTYLPDNQKGLANAALAALMDGKHQEAFDLSSKARQLDPKDPHATALYIQALDKLGRARDLQDLLAAEPWVTTNPQCSFALGWISLNQGNYEEAERQLRVSLKGDKKDPRAYILFGQAIFIPLQRSLLSDPPLPWLIDEQRKSQMKEIEDTLTTAVALSEAHENRALRNTALASRAGVRGMLDDVDGALRDCDAVLAEDEYNDLALRNKGLILIRLGRPSEAVSCFEKIRDANEREATVFPLAQAYAETHQYDKAAAILTPLWDQQEDEKRRIRAAELLLVSSSKSGDRATTDRIVTELIETLPNDPDALVVAAQQLRRDGNVRRATELVSDALRLAQGNQKARMAVLLGDLYHAQRLYGEAAKSYREFVSETSDVQTLQRYLISLYNTGSYSDALHLASQVRSLQGAKPIVTEIESMILEEIGDLNQAKELRRALTIAEPENGNHYVRVALIEYRQGHRSEARETVSRIDFDLIKGNVDALIQVAQLRALTGLPDVLPFAYRARRIDFGNPNTHLAYIGLFLRYDQSIAPLLSPEKVGLDCTVHLKGKDGTKAFTILDDDLVDPERGELLPADQLAAKLIGLRRGDTVELRKTAIEELVYTVVDVQSKYVYAFRQTMAEFPTRFPDHPALQHIEIKDNDFTKFFTVVDERDKLIVQAEKLYYRNRLPLCAFAQLIQSPMTRVWGGMVGQVGRRLLSSSGTEDERAREEQTLSANDSIVIDQTALLTVGYLELGEHLTRRFNSIIVPQSTLDELNEAIASDFLGVRPSMTVSKERGHYVRGDVTAADLERGRSFLERVRSFIESSTEVVPVKELLSIGRERFNDLSTMLGASAAASLLVAKERSLPFFSDDLGLRVLGRSEWGVEGFWSQGVLQNMRAQGILTPEQVYEGIRKLALGNYYFVSVDLEFLMWILEKNNMTANAEVVRVFELLEGPHCDEVKAVDILARLVRKVWDLRLLEHQKIWVLDLCLRSLVKGRNANRVTSRFSARLQKEFLLMPTEQALIDQSIVLWRKYNLLIRG